MSPVKEEEQTDHEDAGEETILDDSNIHFEEKVESNQEEKAESVMEEVDQPAEDSWRFSIQLELSNIYYIDMIL